MAQPKILGKNSIQSYKSNNNPLHQKTVPYNINTRNVSKRLNPSMAISLNSDSLQPGNKYFRRFLNFGNQGRNTFKIFNKPDKNQTEYPLSNENVEVPKSYDWLNKEQLK
jgi:hypothetical protein